MKSSSNTLSLPKTATQHRRVDDSIIEQSGESATKQSGEAPPHQDVRTNPSAAAPTAKTPDEVNQEQELLIESLKTLLRANKQHQDKVKGQLVFQEALWTMPMDTLCQFKDSANLRVELAQLRRNETTPS